MRGESLTLSLRGEKDGNGACRERRGPLLRSMVAGWNNCRWPGGGEQGVLWLLPLPLADVVDGEADGEVKLPPAPAAEVGVKGCLLRGKTWRPRLKMLLLFSLFSAWTAAGEG